MVGVEYPHPTNSVIRIITLQTEHHIYVSCIQLQIVMPIISVQHACKGKPMQ